MTARDLRSTAISARPPAQGATLQSEALSFREAYQLHLQLEARRRLRLGGWSSAFIALLAAGGLWLVAKMPASSPPPYSPPPAAIAIDLAPEPASIASSPQERPPGPPQISPPELPAPEKPPEVMAPPSPAALPPIPVPKKSRSRRCIARLRQRLPWKSIRHRPCRHSRQPIRHRPRRTRRHQPCRQLPPRALPRRVKRRKPRRAGRAHFLPDWSDSSVTRPLPRPIIRRAR